MFYFAYDMSFKQLLWVYLIATLLLLLYVISFLFYYPIEEFILLNYKE